MNLTDRYPYLLSSSLSKCLICSLKFITFFKTILRYIYINIIVKQAGSLILRMSIVRLSETFRHLDQKRVGERLHKMAVLPEKRGYTVKNTADPLFVVCLTNQHPPSGEVIGNGLVLAFPVEERRGN